MSDVQIKTYLGISEVGFPITNLNISGAENLSGSVSDLDLFIIDDGGGGTNRKVTALTLKNWRVGGIN